MKKHNDVTTLIHTTFVFLVIVGQPGRFWPNTIERLNKIKIKIKQDKLWPITFHRLRALNRFCRAAARSVSQQRAFQGRAPAPRSGGRASVHTGGYSLKVRACRRGWISTPPLCRHLPPQPEEPAERTCPTPGRPAPFPYWSPLCH